MVVKLTIAEIERLEIAIQGVLDTLASSEPEGADWQKDRAMDVYRNIISGKIIATQPRPEFAKLFNRDGGDHD